MRSKILLKVMLAFAILILLNRLTIILRAHTIDIINLMILN